MEAAKYALQYTIAGFVIPVLFTLFWNCYETAISFEQGLWIERLMLILWPSSFFMMGTAGHNGIEYEVLSVSIVVNIVLYTVLGLLIWFGLNKQKWILYIVFILVTLGWYKLLRL